jgi:hypothetical protein
LPLRSVEPRQVPSELEVARQPPSAFGFYYCVRGGSKKLNVGVTLIITELLQTDFFKRTGISADPLREAGPKGSGVC